MANTNRNPTVFFTVKQVAAELQVSTRTVWRWIDDGELPIHRFGRAVRIALTDYEAFLALRRQCRVVSTKVIERQ
jgi:excisionase family DNA binding protein